METLTTTNHINTVFSIHLKVLRYLLIGKTFEWIKEELKDDFEQTNYLDYVVASCLLSFDGTNKLIGAYPISPVKSKYRIDIEGIGSGYAMCAIDALGVAFTFGAKTVISTVDQTRKKPISITIDPNIETFPNQDVVVTYKRKWNGKNAAVDQCPNINFYLSRTDVPRDQSLEILSFQEALNHARNVFSPDGLKSRISEGINSPMSNCCSKEF